LDILFLSQYFYPEQFLNTHIVKALAAKGNRVTVICCVPNYPAGKFHPGYSNRRRRTDHWPGVEIHRVFTIPRGRTAVALVANYLTYPLAASARILRLGRRRSGDVSFVSMPSPLFQAFAGIFAKWVWGIPTVYWVQDIWPDSAIITLGIRNRLLIRLLNALCGWIYRQADLVMVQSDGFHEKIGQFGVPAERIVTLPNSAPETFGVVEPAMVPARIRDMIPVNRRIVMFAGNIGESQDFDTVIAAASLLPPDCDVLIVVIGSGRDEARVRAKVESEGLSQRFLFLGRHPEADMPLFFACADAMLVTLRDEPIFALTVPSKVQAYLACGKPIVASLAGEGANVIDKAGAGFTVAPSSPAQLSIALTGLAQLDTFNLASMGRSGRAYYNTHFSLERIIIKLATHLAKTRRDPRIV